MDNISPMLSPDQNKQILETLKHRFEKNMQRHPKLERSTLQTKLENETQKLRSLYQMEITG